MLFHSKETSSIFPSDKYHLSLSPSQAPFFSEDFSNIASIQIPLFF